MISIEQGMFDRLRGATASLSLVVRLQLHEIYVFVQYQIKAQDEDHRNQYIPLKGQGRGNLTQIVGGFTTRYLNFLINFVAGHATGNE